MNEGASRRLLQEILASAHYNQVATYATAEVNLVNREIIWRFNEIHRILAHQRSLLRRSIVDAEHGVMGSDTHIICEFPHVALWTHVSAIQQLQRALHIYRHERMKCINHIVLESFTTGCPISNETIGRMGPQEIKLTKELQKLLENYGTHMISLCSGVAFRRFQNVTESAIGGASIVFPDLQFLHRMGRLSRIDKQPGVTHWRFDDETLKIQDPQNKK